MFNSSNLCPRNYNVSRSNNNIGYCVFYYKIN